MINVYRIKGKKSSGVVAKFHFLWSCYFSGKMCKIKRRIHYDLRIMDITSLKKPLYHHYQRFETCYASFFNTSAVHIGIRKETELQDEVIYQTTYRLLDSNVFFIAFHERLWLDYWRATLAFENKLSLLTTKSFSVISNTMSKLWQ